MELRVPGPCAGPEGDGGLVWRDMDGRELRSSGGTVTVSAFDAKGERFVIVVEERGLSRDATADLEAIVASMQIETTWPWIPQGDPWLSAGWHAMPLEDVRLWFRVPRPGRWEGMKDDVYISRSVVGPRDAEAITILTSLPDGAFTDPALVSSGRHAAMSAAPGIEPVGAPVPAQVGGLPATQLLLTVREDRGCQPGYFFSWELQDGGAFWTGVEVGDRIGAWIVDVDGVTIVVEAITRAGVADSLVLGIGEIVESISFE